MNGSQNLVHSDGMLNETLIIKREPIYKGMNGRSVERIYTSTEESFIFKPLTNDRQFGKELWVHEHILAKLPPIYPKILAHSESIEGQDSWIILEDLGLLTHDFSEELACEVLRLMTGWHGTSVTHLYRESLTGPKPLIEEIVSDIEQKKTEILHILSGLQVKEERVTNMFSLLTSFTFSLPQVLSHGDLHLGNYAYAGNRVVVLDWEHMHFNSPFWDLYHVIDMSHPVFPKTVTDDMREKLLKTYWDFASIPMNAEAFHREYYLYSAAFSIWMITLIVSDLAKNDTQWSEQQLRVQLNESVMNLNQCLAKL